MFHDHDEEQRIGSVTAPVAATAAAVAGLAQLPLRDPDLGFLVMGVGPDAEPTLAALARIRHSLDAATARHMVACEQSGATAHDPVTVLQAQGWTGSEARRLLLAGRFTERIGHIFPELEQLWESGGVSTAQVRALAADTHTRSMRDTCDMVRVLLPRFAALPPAQISQAAEALLTDRDPATADSSEQDTFSRRRLTITDTEAGVRISGMLPHLEGRALAAVVEAMAEQQRAEGDGLSRRQRRADGLAAVVAAAADTHRPSQGGLPAAVVMTLPVAEAERISSRTPRIPGRLSSLLDCENRSGTDVLPDLDLLPLPGSTAGHSMGDGEARFGLCCADITPIAVNSPDSLLDRICDTRTEPLAVGRAQRLATAAQRKALALRDGGCVIDGCTVPAARCQPHHVREWSLGAPTDLANLALLCWAHHRQVDLARWELSRSEGRWRATPTPRHRWRTKPAPHPEWAA